MLFFLSETLWLRALVVIFSCHKVTKTPRNTKDFTNKGN